MLRNLCCTVCGLTLAATCLSGGSLSAQDPVFSQFYGSGVHSYYERDYFQALDSLSVAIDGGTKDPRAHYYRGLAHMKLGNSAAARSDMQKGAQLESADINQFYPVGKSLERVQGSDRMQLERYRSLARAQARRQQLQRDAARYEQRRRAEAHVLRSVPVGPPPAALRPAPVAPAAAAEPTAPAAAPTPFDEPPAAQPDPASPFDPPAADAPAAPPADEQPAAEPGAANPFNNPDAETPDDAAPADAAADDAAPDDAATDDAATDDNPFNPE